MTIPKQKTVTRFAPSPTGGLHIGHAYSALEAWRAAQEADGRFLLRIEDIDTVRCREEFVDQMFEDLAWLGLIWEEPVRRQSEHFEDYAAALDKLKEQGLVYPCFCTRKEIQAEIARSPSAPHGPDGALYPGTCRHLSEQERTWRVQAGKPYAWRLDVAAATSSLEQSGAWPRKWQDALAGEQVADPGMFGDVVLARKDTPTSYHLSVVVDDALQGITHIVRGQDLFHATHIHVLLQALLGLKTPLYEHHGLLLDDEGKRFAKRDRAKTLAAMRSEGTTTVELRKIIYELAPG